MDKRESDLLSKVDKILASPDGARIVHDFIDGLVAEMETLTARVDELRLRLARDLSDKIGAKIEPHVIAPPPADFTELMARVTGSNPSIVEIPSDAHKIYEAVAPELNLALARIEATSRLVDGAIERMYGIPRTP